MPGLDGLALCRALKADPGTHAIPILLVSGETRALPSDGDGFLAKPFNALRLRAEVERLLRGPP
jgi:CheY-like chemotaxis protein